MRALLTLLLLTVAVCAAPLGFNRNLARDNRQLTTIGGLPQSSWVNNGTFGGSNTFVHGRWNYNIRQPADKVFSVTVWIDTLAVGGNSNTTWRAKIWTQNYSNNFSFVGEQQFTATTGTNVVRFQNTVTAREGDVLGIFVPGGTTPGRITQRNVSGPKSFFDAGDVSAVNHTFTKQGTGGQGIIPNICATAPGPAWKLLGDSFISGFPDYYPYPATLAGDGSTTFTNRPENSPPYMVWQKVPAIYRNDSRGGMTSNWGATNVANGTIATDAEAYVIHFGGNDIATGNGSWDYWRTNMNTILSFIPRSKPTLIIGIPPVDALNDTDALTRRQINTNIARYCRENGRYFYSTDKLLGTNRTSTGQLDNLKPEFMADSAHINTAGEQAVAGVLANWLKNWVK